MLRNVITFYLVVLVAQALCALAEPMYIMPTRITTKSTPGMEGWKALLKKNIDHMLVGRQDNGGGGGSGNKTLDVPAWEARTMQICQETLRNTTIPPNPAGIAVCYNIAYFKPDLWTFLAELKLFKFSEPDKEWAAIGTDVQVEITYKAAAADELQLGNATSTTGNGIQLVKEFYFIGRVNENFRKPNLTDADMRQIVTPEMVLIAKKSDGSQLRTNISSNQTMFITGEFVATPPPPVEEPFKLPGTTIAIMPIGLIFYSAYLFLGVVIVMYGTFERRRYRDQYRKRVAESTPGAARI